MNEETMQELGTLKMSKDLRKAAETMEGKEARYLIDLYMTNQENRLRAAGKIRAADKEPHRTLEWLEDTASNLEKQAAAAIKCYAESQPMGQWALQIRGIGPIAAATLCAHIDITKCPTVGHIWAFAGMAGSGQKKWEKKTKRPWNAALKRACRMIAENGFEKGHNHPDCFYGKIYEQRKSYEQAKNEAGDYADQAKAILEAKKFDKSTEAYKAYSVGKLPPGHIRSRALRFSVKLFLAHWHEEAYRQHYHKEPPLPYPIAFLGHAHKIEAPISSHNA